MIITRRKPIEDILAMLGDGKKIALVGCASCAASCQTGGEKELAEMKAFLEERGFEVVATVLPGECCHKMLVKKELKVLKNTGCEQLVGMTNPTFTMFEPADILYDGDTLSIEDLIYSYYLPDFGMEHRWDWEKIDLILVVNREEVSRVEEGPWRQPDEDGVSPGGLAHILHARFPVTDLQEGDDIRLYIDVELSSGITARVWLMAMALVDGKVEYGIMAN